LVCHTATWICHRYTRVPHPEPSSLLPSHTIPLGHLSAPAPSIEYQALNLDWWSFHIWYYTCFNAILPNHPTPSPTESKRLFYTSVFLLLPRIQCYHCHLSKFHIYALVYCISVFLYFFFSFLYFCFSFWLTSLCIIGSSFIHLIRTDSNIFLRIFSKTAVQKHNFLSLCFQVMELRLHKLKEHIYIYSRIHILQSRSHAWDRRFYLNHFF